MTDLSEAFTRDFSEKWDTFRVAAQDARVPIPRDPIILSALKPVFTFSDFVAKGCIRSPETLKDLIDSGDLQKKYNKTSFTEELSDLLSPLYKQKNEARLSSILRHYRLREMLRIAWRDLAFWADLTETMTDLSNLADAVIDQTLSVLYNWHCLEYGIPSGLDGSEQHLAVIGMGKLGGRELNFSSDVDLIFTYPETGVTEGGPAFISNQEFFTHLCQRLINVIGATTADGIVFRVDMRLRPYGEGGPLVMSFDAMEAYYQDQGREWERYAWIKARIVAGDKEAGARLLERLRPFVYRRYLDYGAFESLREMKQRISLEVKRKGMKANVKLGPGGIREIEFFGQIFQLIRGGVVPVLQERGIQRVLMILVSENYISRDICDRLLHAYEFLRNTEHRLQEFSDHQTHQLPTDAIGRQRLASSMGFGDWASFVQRLQGHMKAVHDHFDKLLGSKDSKDSNGRDQDMINELKGIWQDLQEHERFQEILLEAGFDKPVEVLQLLEHLRNNPATKELSSEGRMRLDRLIPLVLREVGRSEQPGLVLNRIIDMIKAIQRRTNYLAFLLENPDTLVHLVKLANASPWIASFLARHPVLLDELLDPRTLYSPPKRADLKREIKKRIDRIPPGDLEYQIIELSIFRQVNTLRVAAADVNGALPLMRVSDYLTEIAETVLDKVLELAWNGLIERHGIPSCLLSGEICDRAFSIIGYGKLGGIELGYGSDLDLVFLHAGAEGRTKGGESPIDNTQFFTRLGQKIIHMLTAATPAGTLYETDMRLRPDGSSGILAVNIEAFKDYQEDKARTWEHQALIRARAICGDTDLIKRFEQIRQDVLVRPRDKGRLQEEVSSMRERMRRELLRPEPGIFDIKQDAGGIVDIEFLVQYLVLLHAHEHVALVKWTDNVRLLQTLAQIGIIDRRTGQLLKDAYLNFRAAVHRLSLQEKPARIPENGFNGLRREVKKIWDDLIEKR